MVNLSSIVPPLYRMSDMPVLTYQNYTLDSPCAAACRYGSFKNSGEKVRANLEKSGNFETRQALEWGNTFSFDHSSGKWCTTEEKQLNIFLLKFSSPKLLGAVTNNPHGAIESTFLSFNCSRGITEFARLPENI